MRICGGGQGVGLRVGVTDLSIGGEGQGVVRPTGHLFEPLPLQVGGHQCGGGALVGGSIAQLAVAIVAPGVQLSACRDRTTDRYQSSGGQTDRYQSSGGQTDISHQGPVTETGISHREDRQTGISHQGPVTETGISHQEDRETGISHQGPVTETGISHREDRQTGISHQEFRVHLCRVTIPVLGVL